MADEPDVPSEITPEDFDGEQEAPKAGSSPDKPEQAKEAEPKEEAEKPEAEEEAKAESEETETESESEDETEETETKPTKADERKTQLNTEIRDLVAQRNALKEEVAKANEVYQPATEEDLVNDGMDATEAKVEALRQAIEVKDYNDKVADAQLTIESESQRVLQDYPIFNPDNESYDEDLSLEAAQLLEANLIQDPNTGQIIGSNVSPYQLYKTLAKASGISGAKGQIKGQQATEKMLANADANSSTAPAKKADDPLGKLWEDPL